MFLVCYQLWKKFGHEFFYLENHTMKFSIYFERNKAKTLLSEIKKLLLAEAKVTVLTKSFLKFFRQWLLFLIRLFSEMNLKIYIEK